jgi:hypothetical protein
MQTVRYWRCYADANGESHGEEVEAELIEQVFAPPAPPLALSAIIPATGFAFARFPAGWVGDWHPTPRRQVFIYLQGEIAGETSDGQQGHFGTGDVTLVEDTWGKGHRSWVVGDVDALLAVVQLPD